MKIFVSSALACAETDAYIHAYMHVPSTCSSINMAEDISPTSEDISTASVILLQSLFLTRYSSLLLARLLDEGLVYVRFFPSAWKMLRPKWSEFARILSMHQSGCCMYEVGSYRITLVLEFISWILSNGAAEEKLKVPMLIVFI